MKDEVWKRDEIQSPCVKLCVVHPEERLCVGCLRSMEEIATWSRLSHEARAAVMVTQMHLELRHAEGDFEAARGHAVQLRRASLAEARASFKRLRRAEVALSSQAMAPSMRTGGAIGRLT